MLYSEPIGENHKPVVFLLVPESALTATVTTSGTSVAGLSYTLTCTVTSTEGLTGQVEVIWIDPNGEQIITSEDVTVGSLSTSGLVTSRTLQFNPLRVNEEGQYTCVAQITSPASSSPLNTSAAEYIGVLIGKT